MTLFLWTLACNPEVAEDIEGDEAGECEDGADNDGNGLFDCDDPSCAGAPACGGEDTGLGPIDRDDEDGDGFTEEEGDCDDGDDAVHPDAVEECNGVDDDCNGEIDDDLDTLTFYADEDGDGYGDPDNPVEACSEPDDAVEDNTDCDDSASDAHPGGTEVDWDGVDQDCDGYDLDIEACVQESVIDATNWVSWWSYDVPDQDADYWVAGYELYNQTLYVDAASNSVSEQKEEPLMFDVNVDSQQALNTESEPFWLDAWLDTTYYFCDGYIDWQDVPYYGTVEVHMLSENDVSATVNLEGKYDGYVQDDIVLWEYATGGSCEVETLDTMLGFGGYDILGFFDSGFSDNTESVANELEDEIVWYIEYNCSEW